jgi:hypothetical protein
MQPLPPGVQEQLNQRCACLSKTLAECDCRSAQSTMQTDLSIAQTHLQAAYNAATEANLGTIHHDLFMGICDALDGCNQALQHLDDEPDGE